MYNSLMRIILLPHLAAEAPSEVNKDRRSSSLRNLYERRKSSKRTLLSSKNCNPRPLDLLCDRLAITLTILLALALFLPSPRLTRRSWSSFMILYLPALVGNFASIPACWLAAMKEHDASPIKTGHIQSSALVCLVNWFFFVPAVTWLASPLVNLEAVTTFEISREVSVFMFYLITAEFWFYGVHFVCHASPTLYSLLHEHHHRIDDPHVVDASYQHPMEMILITMGTAWTGSMIVNGHVYTVALHQALIMIGGNFGHCGISSIHDAHHRIAAGNYGFLGLADFVFGTSF